MPNAFIFQINPKEYRIWEALRHVTEHDNLIVLSPRRSRLLTKGSTVYLWQAGGAGLVARGTISDEKILRTMPEWQHEFSQPGSGKRVVPRVGIDVDSVAGTPVSWEEISQNKSVRTQPFFRNRAIQGTVFRFNVSSAVLAELDKMLGRYLSPPEAEASESGILEGARISVLVNRFERDRDARRRSIEKFGVLCSICGFDFQKKYGEIGKGFIHVHHLIPLHKIGKQYRLNVETDLRPVCPNCHAMLHRGNTLLSIEELKSRLRTA